MSLLTRIEALSRPRTSTARLSMAVLVIALTKLGLHLSINAFGAYGYIRDELYYFACSDHMAWGHVITRRSRSRRCGSAAFGDSIVGLRLLPALSGAATIVVTGLLAARLGVSRSGQALARFCALGAPLGARHGFAVLRMIRPMDC